MSGVPAGPSRFPLINLNLLPLSSSPPLHPASASLSLAVTPHDEFYADVLQKAMSGVMTDDSRLINTIVGRRHRLSGINWVFVHKFGSSLRARWVWVCCGG